MSELNRLVGSSNNYALHSVIINKPISLSEAIKLSQDIIKNKNRKFYKETSNTYRFRNIPKTKFNAKSFRTKKINDKISLVFGELKLKGEGLMDNEFMKYTPIAGKIYNALSDEKEVENPIAMKNSEKMPDTKIIFKMLDNGYARRFEDVGEWKLIYKTDSLLAYLKGNVIVIALRGTDIKQGEDLLADIKIAFGDLKSSTRYKKDVEDIKKIQERYPKSQYSYIGVGHSLSGAIIDELIENGYLEEGLSFNPAIQKKHYNSNLRNRRIYIETDPLHQMMGKYTKYREVRKTDADLKTAHSLDNFVGGGWFTDTAKFFKDKAIAVKDKIVNVFSPKLDGYNNVSSKTLKDYGNLPIQSLTIYRTPIQGFINTALNALSLGKWNELKTKYGFDELFHLALVANVGSKNIIIEKNEVVNISTEYKTSSDTQTYTIDISRVKGPSFTVYNLVENTRKRIGDNQFFSYDAFRNNCQNFLRHLLMTYNLYTYQVNKFVFQDITEIYKGLPSFVSKIARTVTDIGATASKLIGKGDYIYKGGKKYKMPRLHI